MKKIALLACLAIIFVLAVFNGVMAFGGCEKVAAFVVTAIFAFSLVAFVGATTAVVAIFATTVVASASALVAISVSSTLSAVFFVSVFVILVLASAVAISFSVVNRLKLSVWRVLPIYLMGGLAIFGSLYFFKSIGWWSNGIGAAGIALILAFWQGCEWYDRRLRSVSLADTVHNHGT